MQHFDVVANVNVISFGRILVHQILRYFEIHRYKLQFLDLSFELFFLQDLGLRLDFVLQPPNQSL